MDMTSSSEAREMLHRSIAAFSDDGKLSVDELDHIIQAGMSDGVLDAEERAVLKKTISKLTHSDFSPELWARVEQLVKRFELDDMN
jgi:uncharacterized membrane protein YebE (DUF533 family)